MSPPSAGAECGTAAGSGGKPAGSSGGAPGGLVPVVDGAPRRLETDALASVLGAGSIAIRELPTATGANRKKLCASRRAEGLSSGGGGSATRLEPAVSEVSTAGARSAAAFVRGRKEKA